MDAVRKPLQGVWNIIRFNWHYYALSFILIIVLFLSHDIFYEPIRTIEIVAIILILFSTAVSLIVSCYVYDFSTLYRFSWLPDFINNHQQNIVNINAGFDETSSIIKSRFPAAHLSVFDFYDPLKHTEVSIGRARKSYPPFAGTQAITTNHLPVNDDTSDIIFAILSAHEIRNNEERIRFFKELRRVLATEGKIIVTEHLRDAPNFLAYNIGFFHFHSKQTWLTTFQQAGLQVVNELKITPFITTFILGKNGNTH